MKITILILTSVVLASFVAQADYQDGVLLCKGEDPSKSAPQFQTSSDKDCKSSISENQTTRALMLARKMAYQLPLKDFEVGIIMRVGQDLSSLHVLRDDMTMEELISRATKVDHNANDSSGSNGVKLVVNTGDDGIENVYDKNRKVEYSHIGFIIKDHPMTRTCVDMTNRRKYEEWTTTHILDPCNKKVGPKINDHGLGMFAADDLFKYKIKILIPPKHIQKRIRELVMDPSFTNNNGTNPILSRKYNMAALWTSLDEQNSNQWPLEVIAAAYKNQKFRNRADAQKVLIETGFRPTRLHATGKYSHAVSFVGKFFTIDLSAQQEALNYSIARIVTALSVEEWMQRNGLIQDEMITELTDQELVQADLWAEKMKARIKK